MNPLATDGPQLVAEQPSSYPAGLRPKKTEALNSVPQADLDRPQR